jgi:hypothetical protein
MIKHLFKSTLARIAILILLIILIVIVALLGKSYLDLRYISSQVGSSMSWDEAHLAFEEQFIEGMSREDVHAKLIELDPSLRGRLPVEPECVSINRELQCSEVILAFEKTGYGFNYVFDYTPDYKFIRMAISS